MEKFRSLPNYKSMSMEVARDRGKAAELEHATTLTEARKIVWGHKPKNNGCKCGQVNCARGKGGKSSHC